MNKLLVSSQKNGLIGCHFCRDSCMLNVCLQHAWLMFCFVSRAPLLMVFIVRNLV